MNTKTAMRYHYTAIKMAKSKKTDLIQCKATGAVIACRWNAKWQNLFRKQLQFSSVQSLSSVRLFATPWTAACQASLSITNSRNLPKPMSVESVMPSNHLILASSIQFTSVQSLSHVQLFVTPWTAERQASLSITNSRNLPKPMSIESVMPSNRLIPFSSHPQSLPASGSFPMSQLFVWGGQNTGASALASFPLLRKRSYSQITFNEQVKWSCSVMSNSLRPHGPWLPGNLPAASV